MQTTADWPASTLDAEGLDSSRLGDLALRIRRGDYGRITSVLVARRGRLVFEEYFNGWSREQPHTMQSVTKSVVSLLAGLAAGQGRLSVNDSVTQFFPGYEPIANPDDRKSAMTVRDLLTMRTGLDWVENPYPGSPLQRLNDCRCDWLRFVLDWRMREQPGTRWEYVSAGTILLGGIIAAATGMRLDLDLRLAPAPARDGVDRRERRQPSCRGPRFPLLARAACRQRLNQGPPGLNPFLLARRDPPSYNAYVPVQVGWRYPSGSRQGVTTCVPVPFWCCGWVSLRSARSS